MSIKEGREGAGRRWLISVVLLAFFMNASWCWGAGPKASAGARVDPSSVKLAVGNP